jgi:FAD/FMN-containing dehydrogenase
MEILDQTAVDGLRSKLRGQVISPGEASYEAARKVYNAMIDRYPAVIARCVDVADVMAVVNFARKVGLPLAVRGGGHNGGGLGTCDDGVVLDLSLMRGIRVDPKACTVLVSGGCTMGDLDHATHPFGLAVPTGVNSTTGIGGLTLGGGFGHLTRKHGLTIDNLLSADMVLSDGRFVTASADQNDDLFWAVRGGGGNFGVVTAFQFRLHPVNTVIAGPTVWSFEKALEVMRFYRDFLSQAPEELSGIFAIYTAPSGPPFPEHLQGRKVCGIVWCYSGHDERAERLFAPVRDFGPPAFNGVRPMPFPTLQAAFDAIYPWGLQWYWRGDFIGELSDEAIDLHLQYGSKLPTSLSRMQLFPLDGAAARVGKNDTAFGHRGARWSQVIVGVDPDPDKAGLIKERTIRYWEALHPYSAGGAYVNFMMDEGVDRIRAAYQDNYDRLAAIKQKYDPTNFFHVNQNIRPKS